MRGKLRKEDVEAMAVVSAVVHSLMKELKSIVPIADAVIHEQFLAKYEAGDPTIVMEVNMAMSDNVETFKVKDLPSLAAIMACHQDTAPVIAPTSLAVERAKLEESSFNLLMEQLAYDLKAYLVWKGKMQNFHSALAHIKLD